MKNICALLIFVFLVGIFACACSVKQGNNSMIKSKRRFAEYVEPSGANKSSNGSVVDLSEGPKLNYDAKFGPQKLNFDIKIVDPY